MTAHNFKDITEKRFGRLVVIKRASNDPYGNAVWNCLCDCGCETKAVGNNLRNGNTKSCGCLREDVLTKHGLSETPEYYIWRGMRDRCMNPNLAAYKNYGGRGITVCKRWNESFEHFIADMGDRPSNKHSIDRIDNDGNYKPENCRWATRTEQNRNKRLRTSNTSGISGVWLSNGKYQAYIGTNGKIIHLGTFKDFFEACCIRKSAEIKYWGLK